MTKNLKNQLKIVCVRQKPKEGEDEIKEYSWSVCHSFHAGIKTHLLNPPYNQRLDLRSDKIFQSAIQVEDSEGRNKDFMKYKPAIEAEDILYKNSIQVECCVKNPVSFLGWFWN